MSGKIRIREIRSDSSLDSPNLVLTFEHGRSRDDQISNHYEAITKLIGKGDVVISLDTSLMNLPDSKREQYFLSFLEAVRDLNLEYRCFESTSDSGRSFPASLFKKKNTKKQEMLVYVPNEIWMQDRLKQSFPLYGARYFVTKGNSDDTQVLEKMFRMIDAEKLDYFKLIAFDAVFIDSIGICSKNQTLLELKELFAIQ